MKMKTMGKRQTDRKSLPLVSVLWLAGIGTLIVIIACLVNGSRMLQQVAEIEKSEAVLNLKQAASLLDAEITKLRTVAAEWSKWDDAYEFAKTASPEFIEENMQEFYYIQNKICAEIWVNEKGESLFKSGYDLTQKTRIELNDQLGEELLKLIFNTEKNLQLEDQSGVLSIENRLFIVCVSTILPTSYVGPPRGLVILARELTEEEENSFTKKLQRQVSLEPLNESQNKLKQVLDQISVAEVTPIEKGNKNLLASAVIEGLNHTGFILKSTFPRSTYLAALHGSVLSFGILISGAVLVALLIAGYTGTQLIRPIFLLKKEMREVKETWPEKGSVHSQGCAEMQSIIQGINEMLQALKQANDVQQALFMDAPDAIVRLTPQNGQIKDCNKLARDLLGVSTLIGMNINTVIPNLEMEMLSKLDRQSSLQIRHVGKTIQISGSAIKLDNEEILQLFMRDISERVEYEQKIEQLLDAEKNINLLKSRFLCSVAHEFKTPLTSLQLNVTALEKDLENPRILKQLKRIENIAHSLSVLVDELKLIGESKSESFLLNVAPFSLNRIVSFVKEDITDYQYFNHNLGIHLETEDKIIGDERLIRHILLNLLTNAVKYSPADSSVSLRIIQETDCRLLIIVEDKGPGLPETIIQNLKKGGILRMQRNDHTKEGSGMGLVITKTAVETHGGSLKITSTSAGTTVTVELPINQAALELCCGDYLRRNNLQLIPCEKPKGYLLYRYSEAVMAVEIDAENPDRVVRVPIWNARENPIEVAAFLTQAQYAALVTKNGEPVLLDGNQEISIILSRCGLRLKELRGTSHALDTLKRKTNE